MNAYQKRHMAAQARTAASRERMQDARVIALEPVLRAYEDAYRAYNGVPVKCMRGLAGRITITGRKRSFDVKQIQAMTAELWARVHEQEINPEGV